MIMLVGLIGRDTSDAPNNISRRAIAEKKEKLKDEKRKKKEEKRQ